MPLYIFEAKDLTGKKHSGSLLAESEQELRIKLRAQQLIPVAIEVQKEKTVQTGGGARVKLKELQIFTRQLAVLVDSGVPIVQSIEAMIGGGKSPAFMGVLKTVITDLESGTGLADAFNKHPNCFDRMYVSLIRAGEEGGVLESVLTRLAEDLEKSIKLRNKVKGALMYPTVILFVSFAVIAAIMTFVIPSFVKIFQDVGQELPPLTQFVITLSDGFKEYWYLVILVMVGLPMWLIYFYRTPEGRKTLDTILIEIPLFGSLIQRSGIARFSRTLASLFSSGVRVLDALDIAAATCGNYVIEQILVQSKEVVSKGRLLSEPFTQSKFIPDMVTQMITVGEQTGNMSTMLNKVADFYEDEVETAADSLTSIIEPIMMVFLGGIIAVLVLALYLPIFNLAGTVG